MKIIVEITEEERKALEYIAYDVQAWASNAVHNRARQAIDQIVEENTQYKANRITLSQKIKIVREAKIKSAAQRAAELEKTP